MFDGECFVGLPGDDVLELNDIYAFIGNGLVMFFGLGVGDKLGDLVFECGELEELLTEK